MLGDDDVQSGACAGLLLGYMDRLEMRMSGSEFDSGS
jgi:hypothetical protein